MLQRIGLLNNLLDVLDQLGKVEGDGYTQKAMEPEAKSTPVGNKSVGQTRNGSSVTSGCSSSGGYPAFTDSRLLK